MRNRDKTHCLNGHPYDQVNVEGARFCSVCYNRYHTARQSVARRAGRAAIAMLEGREPGKVGRPGK